MSCWCSCQAIFLVLTIIILIKCSLKARYYFKMITFAFGSLMASLLAIPQFIIRRRDYRNGLIPAWFCRSVCNLLGVTFEIRGIENINRNKGGIILINHQSSLDLAVIAHLWPIVGPCSTVVRKEILYLFPFGPASYMWETLFLDRSNAKKAHIQLNKETNSIIERNYKLLFCPEGTRHQGDELLPFKKGAFNIAIQSKSMVQPIVISKYMFLDSDKKIFGRGKSIISILPEIDCSKLEKDDLPKLLDDTQNLMQKHYTELTNEVKHRHY